MDGINPWAAAWIPQNGLDDLPTIVTRTTISVLSATLLLPNAAFPVLKRHWAVMHIAAGYFWPPTLLPSIWGFVKSTCTLGRGLMKPADAQARPPLKLYLLALVGAATSTLTIFYCLSHSISTRYGTAENYASQVLGKSLADANEQCANNIARPDTALIAAAAETVASMLTSTIQTYFIPAMWLSSVHQSFFKKDAQGKKIGAGWSDLPYHLASSLYIGLWPTTFTTSIGAMSHTQGWLTSIDANQLGKIILAAPISMVAVYNIILGIAKAQVAVLSTPVKLMSAVASAAYTVGKTILLSCRNPVQTLYDIPRLPGRVFDYFAGESQTPQGQGFWGKTLRHALYFYQLGHWQNIMLKGAQAVESIAKFGWNCAPLKILS